MEHDLNKKFDSIVSKHVPVKERRCEGNKIICMGEGRSGTIYVKVKDEETLITGIYCDSCFDDLLQDLLVRESKKGGIVLKTFRKHEENPASFRKVDTEAPK